MSNKIKPLLKGAIFFDPVLNAIVMADGDISSYNTHNMTMLWPSYSALDMTDQASVRLIPAIHNKTTNIIEYYDTNLCKTVSMNLATGQMINPSSTSQQNWGWSSKNDDKKEEKKQRFLFNSVLFHTRTRTKWVFTKADNEGAINALTLRSFYDREVTKIVYEQDFNEYEEIFF